MTGPSTQKAATPLADCELCTQAGGNPLWQDEFARVVLVADADHPAYCRVILRSHVREMTDLDQQARARLMRIVFEVEQALRQILRPEKMNLASLGNMVPHLHWHVIPRFRDDPHFPNPVWGPRSGRRPKPVPKDFERVLARNLAERLRP